MVFRPGVRPDDTDYDWRRARDCVCACKKMTATCSFTLTAHTTIVILSRVCMSAYRWGYNIHLISFRFFFASGRYAQNTTISHIVFICVIAQYFIFIFFNSLRLTAAAAAVHFLLLYAFVHKTYYYYHHYCDLRSFIFLQTWAEHYVWLVLHIHLCIYNASDNRSKNQMTKSFRLFSLSFLLPSNFDFFVAWKRTLAIINIIHRTMNMNLELLECVFVAVVVVVFAVTVVVVPTTYISRSHYYVSVVVYIYFYLFFLFCICILLFTSTPATTSHHSQSHFSFV